MFGYFIILFTVLPAIELTILIQVGAQIGVGSTLFLIILTGVSGAYLARLQGFHVLKEIQSHLAQGQMPSAQLLDGFMILLGGLVLLTPGFITDTLGFLLLIPTTRSLIKIWFKDKFQTMIARTQAINIMGNQKKSGEQKHYDDIDI